MVEGPGLLSLCIYLACRSFFFVFWRPEVVRERPGTLYSCMCIAWEDLEAFARSALHGGILGSLMYKS